MKTFISFIVGLWLGIGMWFFVPTPPPEIKYVTQHQDRIVQEEVIVEKECAPLTPPLGQQCLSPAYVLGLMQDCRAGKLDQSLSDFTFRK